MEDLLEGRLAHRVALLAEWRGVIRVLREVLGAWVWDFRGMV